ALIMCSRNDGNPFARDVNTFTKALAVDVWKLRKKHLFVEMGAVEIHAFIAACDQFVVDRLGYDVARGQFTPIVIAQHESLTIVRAKVGAVTANRLGDEEGRIVILRVKCGRVKLD